MEFSCIQDCSQCCIEREYYPGKKFGKIGVLILPEEKE
ncbi:MAG: YkgJ family cysteine cluster protein, partial [Candidatus Nitrosomaritimum yanchengensis]